MNCYCCLDAKNVVDSTLMDRRSPSPTQLTHTLYFTTLPLYLNFSLFTNLIHILTNKPDIHTH